MANLVQLVFYGEVLAGYDAATARECLATLLKLDAGQLNAVFSGQRIVLRKGMSQAEAELYLLHMQHMGLRAQIEDAPAVLVTPMAATSPALAEALEVAASASPVLTTAAAGKAPPILMAEPPSADEMSCPKCGERQPPRTLCRACAVDMKRFVAAQKEMEDALRIERLSTRGSALTHRRVAPPSMRIDPPGMIGFGFSGRLGRCAYLGGLFLGSAIMAMGWLLTLKTQSWMPAALFLLLSFYYSVRIVVLRCHDKDWSGWLYLLCLVPVVNVIFLLMLLFMPGTPSDNEYGEKAPSAGPLAPIMMLALYGLLAITIVRPANRDASMQMLVRAGALAPQNDAEVQSGNVVLYMTSWCGYCKQAMAHMDKQGIAYTKKDIERYEVYKHEFQALGGGGVPYIVFDNGRTMRGFEPLQFEYLRKQ
jgi:uncharacterized membrane protein YhaH (DUF805 family)/glutaredoxin